MRNDTTTMKLTALLPALALGGLLLTGCEPANETTTLDGDVDTIGVAVDDHAGHDHADDAGDMLDGMKNKAEGAMADAEAKAGALGGDIAEKAEAMKDKAADAAGNVAALADGKLEEAKGMLDDITSKVKNMNFSGAQETMDKLKGMPYYDKLPQAIRTQVEGLADKIKAGLDGAGALGEKAAGLMNK